MFQYYHLGQDKQYLPVLAALANCPFGTPAGPP